jgi:hypothetical protein
MLARSLALVSVTNKFHDALSEGRDGGSRTRNFGGATSPLLLRNTQRVNTTARLIDPAPWAFFGTPSLSDLGALDAQVAFLGVPYDAGTPEPGIPTGQRAGPAAAREASGDQFFYPRSAGAGDDPGAEGWYEDVASLARRVEIRAL